MDPAAQLANAVTERMTIPVRGGVENWQEQLKFMLQTIQKQPGYLRTRWGPWSEDQQRLEFLIAWDNAEASVTWNRSRDHAEAMTMFAPVLNGHPSNYLLQFRPAAPQAVVNSPVVEMITFENCNEPEERMREVVERARSMPGCNGVASGLSLSSSTGRMGGEMGGGGMGGGGNNNNTTTTGGNGGRTFVAAIGWAGVNASRAANKATYTGGMKIESHHVDYNFPVKGFGGL